MTMPPIQRDDLCRAVGAGIAANSLLTEPMKDRLRQVAVSTKIVGRNYRHGCPWTQAFGYEDDILGNFDAYPNDFAHPYDDVIHSVVDYDPFEGFTHLAVIEGAK
jgi:hypothetical protein